MGAISLPLFKRDAATTIEDVLLEMKNSRRAGVVLERNDDKCLVLYARDLLEARRDGVHRLGDIVRGYPCEILDSSAGQKFSLDLVRPLRTQLA